jgi:hypothetical protein
MRCAFGSDLAVSNFLNAILTAASTGRHAFARVSFARVPPVFLEVPKALQSRGRTGSGRKRSPALACRILGPRGVPAMLATNPFIISRHRAASCSIRRRDTLSPPPRPNEPLPPVEWTGDGEERVCRGYPEIPPSDFLNAISLTPCAEKTKRPHADPLNDGLAQRLPSIPRSRRFGRAENHLASLACLLSASGARNFIKMAQNQVILRYVGDGEVVWAVEKLRPLACLIRSVRA